MRKSSKSRSRRGSKRSTEGVIILRKSKVAGKKYSVKVGNKTINFGASGYKDYTKHHEKSRQGRYVSRHRSRENWSKSGIKTAGFWSRWLLWNKPSLGSSIRDVERRFGVKIRQV